MTWIDRYHHEGAQMEILGQDYYISLLEAIREAKKSIWLMNYVISYHFYKDWHRSSHIFQALTKAKKSGFDIKVILDSSSRSSPNHSANFFTFKRLREAGIEVRTPRLKLTCHAKLWIIDEYRAYIGSHNISDASLDNIFELSILIFDPSYIDFLSQKYREIWESDLVKPWERR